MNLEEKVIVGKLTEIRVTSRMIQLLILKESDVVIRDNYIMAMDKMVQNVRNLEFRLQEISNEE